MKSVRSWMAFLVIGVASISLLSCATVAVPADHDGIRAVDDLGTIQRGRYLVYGPAHCAACHGDPTHDEQRRLGREVPLSGGRAFHVALLGTIVAPNITSDPVVGIGTLSDATLVRSLRYGISRHGRPLAPFMSFADMTDDDLQAILSFLRTLPPVAQRAEPSELTRLGAFSLQVVLGPVGPAAPPAAQLTPARSAAYGRYLAHTVANCHGCHTRRSRLTGAFVGPPFGGGLAMTIRAGTFIPPNLTPDGILNGLSEEDFIARFRVDGRGRRSTHALGALRSDDERRLGRDLPISDDAAGGRRASAGRPRRDRRREHAG